MSNTYHHTGQKRNACRHGSTPKYWRTHQDKRWRRHVTQVLYRLKKQGEPDEQPLFNDKKFFRDWFW